MVLFKLFIVFSKIGLFAFGGAYSFLPLTEREVVQNHHWLDKTEFLEVVGITKMFPGAISIKFATYTGYKLAGVPGAIVANLANLLPPVLFIMLASLLYSKYKDIPFVKASLQMAQYAIFSHDNCCCDTVSGQKPCFPAQVYNRDSSLIYIISLY